MIHDSRHHTRSSVLHEYRVIALPLLIAISLRIIFLFQSVEYPFSNYPSIDGRYHDAWAVSIANGNIIGDHVFFRAPLYPYFLASIYAVVGHEYLAVKIIQHLLGCISVLLVYLIARRIFDLRVALLASLLTAIYPMLIYTEGELLFETLLIVLCLGWMLALMRAEGSSLLGRWFITGLLCGLACITRPTLLAVGLPLLVYAGFAFEPKGSSFRVRFSLVLLAGIMIPVLSTTIRNYLVGDDLVLIASQGGVNFYIGNNAQANGYSAILPELDGATWDLSDATQYVEQQLGRRPMPSEESAFWYGKALDDILEDPVRFATLLLKKLLLLWHDYEIPNNRSIYFAREWIPLLQKLPLTFGILAPFAIIGLVFAWRKRQAPLPIAFVALYSIVTILFFVCDRFRLPMIPFLCIFAGAGVHYMVSAIRARQFVPFGTMILLGVLSAVMVNATLVPTGKFTFAREYLSLGVVAHQQENHSEAIDHLQKAAELDPSLPNIHLLWGMAEWKGGDLEKGIEKFYEELSVHPLSFDALLNLHSAYQERRTLDSAMHYARKAVERRPSHPAGYIAAAKTYLIMNQPARAESILVSGSLHCGKEFTYGSYLLAGIWLDRGMLTEAEKEYRSLLEADARSSSFPGQPDPGHSPEQVVGESPQVLRGKAHYGLAHVLVRRGDIERALLHFRAATSILPEYGDAWADLGVGLLQMGRPDEAVQPLRRGAILSPQNHIVWFNLGVGLERIGNIGEARLAFEKCLNIQPGFAPARRRLAFLTPDSPPLKEERGR